jgi:hypothetical protein
LRELLRSAVVARVRDALAVSALVAFACCLLSAASARAGWQRAIATPGRSVTQVAFDAANEPWAIFQTAPESPGEASSFLARLTGDHRFVDIHRVPRIPGNITYVDDLVSGVAGTGYVLMGFNVPYEKAPPIGVAVAAWRGGRIERPILLTPNKWRGPSMAIDEQGTAVVLWASDTAVHAARLRGGRVLGEQQLPVAGGRSVNSAEVLVGPRGGFHAYWELRAGGNSFNLAALGSAQARQDGLLRAPALAAWPPSPPSIYGTSEAKLVSDARGDQVALWDIGIERPAGREVQLYAASRRAGRAFGSPQLLGEAEGGSYGRSVAIGPTGRITILWQPAVRSRLLVSGGYAGNALTAARPVSRGARSRAESEPRVVVTARDRAIAVWTVGAGGRAITVAATSDDGVHFTRPTRISTGGRYIEGCERTSLLTLDRRGGAFASWSCTFRKRHTIGEYSRYRP